MVEVVHVLLALMVLLALVSVLMPLAARLALPQTTLLALIGLALGALTTTLAGATDPGPIADIVVGLGSMGVDAEIFLYVFLPPLLFTAGMGIDVRRLFDDLALVLLLAVVAVVICTGIVGLALHQVSGIGLIACLLLGAIISTTDPAAVIGLFRDLGAPRRLSLLVAGESLFNDAAAIALFVILMASLTATGAAGLAEGLWVFLVDFAGGIALGYLLARLVCLLLPPLAGLPVAAITLTVALAWTSYIIADRYVGVSGVIAVVTAALTFGVHGRTRLPPEQWLPLQQTWEQLEFWANSLIFVLAAMLAFRVLPAVGRQDVLQLLVVIASAFAARALVLFLLLPALTRSSLAQPVAGAFRLIMLWGGVRGAVTLTLALTVSQTVALPPEIRHAVSVLATGFVLFTLLVAAPTLRPMLRLLGLDRLTRVEAALRDRVMDVSRHAIRRQLRMAARDYGLPVEAANALAPHPGDHTADEAELAEFDDLGGLSPAERTTVGLLALAARERALYARHFQERTISRQLYGLLLAKADQLIDQGRAAGADGYLAAAGAPLNVTGSFRRALWLHRRLGWDRPLARRLAERFEALLVTQRALRELASYATRSLAPLLGPTGAGFLAGLLATRQQALGNALAALELQYPAFAAALRRQHLARVAIRLEEAEYHRSFEDSLVSREVYVDLQRRLRDRRAALERPPNLDLGLDLAGMIGRVPMFAPLNAGQLRRVARTLRPQLALPGERVVRRGAKGRDMYFIASGRVEIVLATDHRVVLGAGEFFGEMALLTERPRSADVVALEYCHLLMLQARDLRRLMRRIPGLGETIGRVATERLGVG